MLGGGESVVRPLVGVRLRINHGLNVGRGES